MKKIIKFLILAIIIINLYSCKDGSIFTKSNEKRILEKWVLTEGIKNSDTPPQKEIYIQDSVEMIYGDDAMTVPYFETLEFIKDFTFTSTKGYNYYSVFETEELKGNWEFMQADGEYEKDERILLSSLTYRCIDDEGDVSTGSLNKYKTYILTITKLTKDELNFNFEILVQNGSTNFLTNGSKKFVER